MIVAIAIAAAGGSGLLMSGSLGDGATEATVPVVVAVTDVARGAVLGPDSITIRAFPKKLVPAGALGKLEEATGRTTLGLIAGGEMLLEAKLAPKGTKGGIAALIPNGMRAIAIQIPNVATGVAGFVLPGNKVDVLISYNERPGAPVREPAEVLLDNVEILAVDQKIDAPAENRMDAAQMRSVTLLVTPDEAAKLHEAMSRGTLHLSLRNPADTTRTPKRPTRGPSFLDGLAKLAETSRKSGRAANPTGKSAGPVTAPRLFRAVRNNRDMLVPLGHGG